MRAKSVFLLMLALGCGLVASIGITQVMAKRNAKPTNNMGEVAAIFVALQDIPMGEPVTTQMVKLEEWPKDKVPPEALSKIEDVEGRRTKTKIYQGSPLLDNLLLTKGASELGASEQIPKGYRVVSVRVDNASGSNMIRPSDRVDVLVHLSQNASKGIAETTTRTILQDVKVFAVNDVYDLDTADNTTKIVAQTISLLVPLEQAEKVILADQLGDIRLVMRGPGDDEEVQTGGVRPCELFGPTEGSKRENEDPFASKRPVPDASQNNEFLNFLNAQQAANGPPPLPEPSESWTMRTISGSEVSQVVMELESEGTDADKGNPSGSKFSLWKLISSSVEAGKRAVQPPTPTPEPTPEPTEPPPATAPQSEEQTDTPSINNDDQDVGEQETAQQELDRIEKEAAQQRD